MRCRLTDDVVAEGVEGGCAYVHADPGPEAFLELFARAAVVGEKQELGGRHLQSLDEVAHLAHHHAGLAGAGARDHQGVVLVGGDGLALPWGEGVGLDRVEVLGAGGQLPREVGGVELAGPRDGVAVEGGERRGDGLDGRVELVDGDRA